LEYYEKVVIPINPRKYKIRDDKMLCPLHSDHDPSLGIVKKKDGTELCHCFGCNYWGDVVGLHIKVSKLLKGKSISEVEAVKELCSIFKVDERLVELESLKDKNSFSQEEELEKAMNNFDIGDFRELIREGKKNKKGINYYNTLLMMMISSFKED
jgi:DNA primase